MVSLVIRLGFWGHESECLTSHQNCPQILVRSQENMAFPIFRGRVGCELEVKDSDSGTPENIK